jgi:hypothetical protein
VPNKENILFFVLGALFVLLIVLVVYQISVPLINLPLERLGELAQKAPLLTAAAAFCGAITAVAALFVARWQLKLNRQNQRETTGKTIFRDFLKLCVEYPDFAYGGKQHEPRYEWFVAHFLWAAEELLEHAPAEWEPNLRLYVSYHRDYCKIIDGFGTKIGPLIRTGCGTLSTRHLALFHLSSRRPL